MTSSPQRQPPARRPKKSPVWLPYLHSIKETRKGIFEFIFNGGEETIPADQILSIMVYGTADTALDTRILTKLCSRGIPIIIHRRNVERSIYISSGPRADPDDTLSAHLIKRSHSRTCTHIARRLLLAKMQSMAWLVDPLPIPDHATVDKIRNIEAVHARAYWDAWFARIGQPQWHRRSKNPASEALDAVSKFCAGITLRWITYHNLSPFHGFLHTPTDYPTLVYDLLEPYRGLVDFIVMRTLIATENQSLWIPHCIAAVKAWLSSQTYVPLTRQIVTHQELFHGAVLSLKFYVLGKQRVFHVPMPGSPQGGRPAKVAFKLYGRHAGKTDFWSQASAVSSASLDIDDAVADAVPLKPPPHTDLTQSDPEQVADIHTHPETPQDKAGPHKSGSLPKPESQSASAIQPAQARATTKAKPVMATRTSTGRPLKATPALPTDFCIIDIETTGVISSTDSIIEIAALKIRDRVVTGSYQTLVTTDAPLTETIRDMTGLSNQDLTTHGIPIAVALDQFLKFISDDLLVGHNVNFDIRFINQALFNLKIPQLVNKSLNTLPVFRKMFPGRPSYSMPQLAADFQVDVSTSHRALADCTTLHQLLDYLYPQAPADTESAAVANRQTARAQASKATHTTQVGTGASASAYLAPR